MPRHLYGAGEIATRLGVSRQRTRQIIDRPDFPQPYDRLGMGAVWLKSEVEAWIREHRPHLAGDEDQA
nr:AlpA family phage regulatory protein [Micromonospora mirobrigensis]